MDSCLEHIMALDGSRMQRELATMYVASLFANLWCTFPTSIICWKRLGFLGIHVLNLKSYKADTRT